MLPLLLLACRQTLSSDTVPDKEAPARWNELLGRVVDAEGLVDYELLEAERAPLDGYVAFLATEEAWAGRMTRDWHAQYLNAYNALVLWQVLERGRPASVRDVTGLVPYPGFLFFHGTQFQLGQDYLSLSDIENERIRWKEMDWRDHAALNCASVSCPPMRAELYRRDALGPQLDDQFRRWIDDPERGVAVRDGVAVMSPIFDWYARDFEFFTAGVDPCTLAASVTRDRAKMRQLYALAEQGCPRTYTAYDWSLNEVKRP